MMEISQRVSPKLSQTSNNIFLNEKLLARVKSIYDKKEQLNLSTEDAKLLEDLYESFKANGATLNKDDKEKLPQAKYGPKHVNLAVRSKRLER